MTWNWWWVNVALLGAGAIYLYANRSQHAPGEQGHQIPSEEELERLRARAAEMQPQLEDVTDEEDEQNGLVEPEQGRAAEALARFQAQEPAPDRPSKWKNREVGAKKAKSLARKEQRRAYFEYLEQEAARRKEREKMEQDMFGDILEEERLEREMRDEIAREKIAQEKQKRREEQEKEQKRISDRRAKLEQELSTREVAKVSDEDLAFARELGTVLHDNKWVARAGPDTIGKVSSQLEQSGHLSWQEVAAALNA